MRLVFLAAACASIALVAMICVFLFGNGLPTIFKIGVTDFFFGQTWRPNNDLYGILPMILGSAYVTRYFGGNRCWCTNRYFNGCVYGAFLPGQHVQIFKTGG